MNQSKIIMRAGLGTLVGCLLLSGFLLQWVVSERVAHANGSGGNLLYLPLIIKPSPMSRVSIASDGTEAAGGSMLPSISADGRYVAFASSASNLVNNDYVGYIDIFVHDRQTRQTSLISVASDGTQGYGDSWYPSISADGRYIAFFSDASNLVSDDTNDMIDVFVHDRQTGQTSRISVASDGTQANGMSEYPAASISTNGRYVAFSSSASNLISGDTNGVKDIFIHDQQTGQTSRVSVASGGTQANGYSWDASISSDGRYVAFFSYATNLVNGDTNNVADVFVHDRQTGQTSRVSVASNGTQGNGDSLGPSISADGRYVAFVSSANNLVSNDINDADDIFVHDQQTGQTSRISVSSGGTQGNDDPDRPALSFSVDGRYVTFESDANNLVSGDTNNAQDIFVHDRQTGQTSRVSIAADGTQGNGRSSAPVISANGSYVAFYSDASNLISDDTNNWQDVFVYDRSN